MIDCVIINLIWFIDDDSDSNDSEQTESKSAGTNSGTSSPAPNIIGFGNKKLFKGGTLSTLTKSSMSKLFCAYYSAWNSFF